MEVTWALIGAVAGTILTVLVSGVLKIIGEWWHHRHVQIATSERRRTIIVTVQNNSKKPVNIEYIRLMFASGYGILASGLKEPYYTLRRGEEGQWGFDEQKLRDFMLSIFPKSVTTDTTVRLRPMVVDYDGKTYKGQKYFLYSLSGRRSREDIFGISCTLVNNLPLWVPMVISSLTVILIFLISWLVAAK